MPQRRGHTQLILQRGTSGLLCLISAGLFTPPGNFQTLFSYTYFPVNHMNTPSNQLPAAVSCVRIPETLFGPRATLQRPVCPGRPGLIFCQHCLLLGLEGFSSGLLSGASGHHHRTLLRPEGEGFPRRAEL